MKRCIIRLCLVLLIIGAILLLGTLVLEKKLGVVVDWHAVFRLQPPIFKTQYRVVMIKYADRQTFEEEASRLGLLGIDIWEMGDDYMIGATTDPNIQKLRKGGFQVEILFETIEDYLKALENQQDD